MGIEFQLEWNCTYTRMPSTIEYFSILFIYDMSRTMFSILIETSCICT